MTDEERSEVAAGLRGLAEATARLPMPDSNLYSLLSGVVFNGADWDIHDRNPNGLFLNRLADLIEPEERTCRMEPTGDGSVVCSACRTEYTSRWLHEGEYVERFCPNCGARVMSD